MLLQYLSLDTFIFKKCVENMGNVFVLFVCLFMGKKNHSNTIKHILTEKNEN